MLLPRSLLLFCLFLPAAFLSAEFCCYPLCGDAGIGYEFFRGIPDGDWEGNTGTLIDVNVATEFDAECLHGYGVQFGASYGVYDWQGRNSSALNRSSVQHQIFITTGIFKTTKCESGWNYGLVYDWMWNKNFGVFAVDPIIDQLRFQGGYTYFGCNEFGLWGTVDVHWSRETSQSIPIRYRALSQINAFWKHTFPNCAETMIWAGVPYKRSLLFSSGRAGKFIAGASFKAPLSDRLDIKGRAAYMAPHSDSGAFRPRNYVANVCLELSWAFGYGRCVECPYLPLANNSNFFVDTDLNF